MSGLPDILAARHFLLSIWKPEFQRITALKRLVTSIFKECPASVNNVLAIFKRWVAYSLFVAKCGAAFA